MKPIHFIFITILLICPLALHAEETEIYKLRKADSRNRSQIYVSFNELPPFTHQQSGKRIDIILNRSLRNTEPLKFEPDDRVVKFLTQHKTDKTILTFFLRYEPQSYKISTPESTTLILDILLGNQFTKAYPELSSRLDGVTIMTQEKPDYANPYVSSPYVKNWRLFFSKYEPEIVTSVPFSFTYPPFPVLSLLPDSENSHILPSEIFSLADQELWGDTIPILLQRINMTTDKEEQKLLALTFGEVLMRSGNFKDGYKQLYLLQKKYKNESIGIAASYLLSLLRAIHEDTYIADYEYRKLEKHFDIDFKLSPYIIISQIESAIATKQPLRAKKLIENDEFAFPLHLQDLKNLRQSDFWYATGQSVKAYVAYQALDKGDFLDKHPYSLNGYCSTLYTHKKYEEASKCYQRLGSLVKDKSQLGNIEFKKGLAELRFKSAREMYASFSAIEDAFPETTSGARAAIKKTDIHYLSQPSWRSAAAEYYKEFYEKSANKYIAEEAALKEAIVHSQLGNTSKSIELIMEFLRNFRTGNLRNTALALLIEILPIELERLVTNEEYIDALVLAKKNRSIFQKNWLDINLLGLMANAYDKLSIHEEARKLYLYLLNSASVKEKVNFYLPLVSILYSLNDFESVEDFATEYNYNYPNGTDRDNIFLFRLKALIADKKFDKAMAIGSTTTLPDLLELKETMSLLHFKNDNYDQVTENLLTYYKINELESIDSKFMLAESLFQEQRYSEAEALFDELKSEKRFYDQSLYRLATIKKKEGNQDKALKLYKEIVEKGNNPLWQELAQGELEFYELSNKKFIGL